MNRWLLIAIAGIVLIGGFFAYREWQKNQDCKEWKQGIEQAVDEYIVSYPEEANLLSRERIEAIVRNIRSEERPSGCV